MCVRYPLIEKYGINQILKPFIDDLKTLYDCGLDIDVQGKHHNFKGPLVVFLADNLAGHLLAGF